MTQNQKTLSKANAILIALFSYLAYSCVYLCRLNLSVASVGLKDLGLMNDSQIGLLSSLFLGAYAAGKLILGRVGDRLPPKLLIVSGLFVSAAANLLFSLFLPVVALYVLWLFNGIAQSLIWGPILRIVSSHFSAEKRSFVLSLLATCIGVGSILGVVVASIGISAFKTTAAAFYLPAAITIFIAVLFAVFVHDEKPQAEKKLPPLPMKELFCDPAFQRMMIPAFLHGIIKDNINVWMGLFFAKTYSLDLEKLAYYVFIIPLLTLAGRIVFLPVLRLCKNNENKVACISFVLCSVFVLLLATGKLPLWLALVCFGGTACTISMSNTTLLSIFPARFLERGCVSSVASYMDVLTYSGAAVGSLVYGFVVNGVGYSPMFLSWFVFALICALIMLHEFKHK